MPALILAALLVGTGLAWRRAAVRKAAAENQRDDGATPAPASYVPTNSTGCACGR